MNLIKFSLLSTNFHVNYLFNKFNKSISYLLAKIKFVFYKVQNK